MISPKEIVKRSRESEDVRDLVQEFILANRSRLGWKVDVLLDAADHQPEDPTQGMSPPDAALVSAVMRAGVQGRQVTKDPLSYVPMLVLLEQLFSWPTLVSAKQKLSDDVEALHHMVHDRKRLRSPVARLIVRVPR